MKRESGIRKFDDNELEALRVIDCLKKSGLEIKEIKQFMQWCREGSATYEKRYNLFVQQEKLIKEEIERLYKSLDMIKFKRWYYANALKDGNEDGVKALMPDKLPAGVQEAYDNAHR